MTLILDRVAEAVFSGIGQQAVEDYDLGRRYWRLLSECDAGSGACPESGGLADMRRQVLEARIEVGWAGNQEGVSWWGVRRCCGYISSHWLWAGPHTLWVRLCAAQHSDTAAGLRDGHRDDSRAVLGAVGFLAKQSWKGLTEYPNSWYHKELRSEVRVIAP